MRTQEQIAAQDAMRAVAPGFRVVPDTEGWPMVPGRKHRRTDDATGRNRDRLDWIGGEAPFAVSIAGRRGIGLKLAALLALPGVRRHQVGDTEARLLVPAEAIPAVLAVIRGQRKRLATGRPFGIQARPQESVGLKTAGEHPPAPVPLGPASGGPDTARGGPS